MSPAIAGADSNGNAEDVTVILNNPTSLVCEAYSYPPATITWLKDGVPLESNRSIRILPGTYFLSKKVNVLLHIKFHMHKSKLLFVIIALFCTSG